MSIVKKLGHRALSLFAACALVLTMTPVAFAATADSYKPTTYRVTVYAGNQGTVALAGSEGAASVQLEAVPLNGTADLSGISYLVPDDSKYYAKGLRIAGLDNIRSDKNTDTVDEDGNPINVAGVDTTLYAVPMANGEVGNATVQVTEDTDFVVAYGILANRVSYTVNYVDADGNQLLEPQTFFGDIGDRPATAPIYIENYLPQATLVVLTLSSDEAQNVVTFRYTRLAEGTTTTQQPSGRVDVTAPDGSTATGAYNTTVSPEDAAAAADQAARAAATAADGNADTPGDPENPVEATPLTTDAGTEVIAADGTPLAVPDVETINDDENALASGEQVSDLAAPAANTAWIPWAVAAAVIVAAMVFVLLRAHQKTQEEEATTEV